MSDKNFLTNKHFIVAMIVAPILAVIAYFGVDRAVSEPPRQAVPGEAYALVASSNCRYKSGRCTFKNGNFKVHLNSELRSEKVLSLHLTAEFPLEYVAIAIVPEEQAEYPPLPLTRSDSAGLEWTITTSVPVSEQPLLRLLASAEGSHYFGQTGLEFTHYETSFHKDFRREE